MKYIDAEKLFKLINNYHEGAKAALNPIDGDADYYKGKIDACQDVKYFVSSLQQEQPEVDMEKEVDFYCINKKVKMTIQELINYYIDTECAKTAIECGF